MCGWVMTIGEMLMPVAGAMRTQLLAGTYIQADETRSMCRRTTEAAPIIKPTCGNTGCQEA
jgi:hypothetical protein